MQSTPFFSVIARSLCDEAIHPPFSSLRVLFFRHCEERSAEAIHYLTILDCFTFVRNDTSPLSSLVLRSKTSRDLLVIASPFFSSLRAVRRGNPYPNFLDCFTFVRNDTSHLSSLVLQSTPFFSVIASRQAWQSIHPFSSLRALFFSSLRAVRRSNPHPFPRHCEPFFFVIASRQAWQSILPSRHCEPFFFVIASRQAWQSIISPS